MWRLHMKQQFHDPHMLMISKCLHSAKHIHTLPALHICLARGIQRLSDFLGIVDMLGYLWRSRTQQHTSLMISVQRDESGAKKWYIAVSSNSPY